MPNSLVPFSHALFSDFCRQSTVYMYYNPKYKCCFDGVKVQWLKLVMQCDFWPTVIFGQLWSQGTGSVAKSDMHALRFFVAVSILLTTC